MQHRYEYLSERVGEEKAEPLQLRHHVPLNAAPAPLLVLSHSGLKFLEVNDAATVQYGFSREEFLQMEYPEIHVMPAAFSFHDLFDTVCKHDRRFSGTIWGHRLRDGRSIDVSVAINSLIFNDQLAYILTPTDVSDFVKREREATLARNREEAILKAIPDLVFEIDLEGRIHGLHSGQREKLLAPESDFIGKLVSEVLPENLQASTMNAIRQAHEHGVSQGNEYQVTLPGRSDPSWFEYSVARLESQQSSPPRFIVLSRDISSKRSAQKELQDSKDFISATLDNLPIGVAINSVSPEVNFQYANKNFFKIYRITPESLSGPDGFWGAVYEDPKYRETIKSRVLGDMASGELDRMIWEEVELKRTGHETRYVTARNIPLSKQGLTVSLVWDVTEAKSDRDSLHDYIQKLETSMLGTVEVAMTISEMRDPYTAGHERRVAAIAVAIGNELGLDEKQIQGIKLGAHLHDVGKIIVPAEFLSRPGRLSPAEFEIIKSHAAAGYSILKAVEFPWPIAEIAHSHHERLDGSGYPRQLKGEEIILEGRIVAVADVVEAMASHRPYRPGLGIDAALSEIEKGSGRLYDDRVVKACLNLFREGKFEIPR